MWSDNVWSSWRAIFNKATAESHCTSVLCIHTHKQKQCHKTSLKSCIWSHGTTYGSHRVRRSPLRGQTRVQQTVNTKAMTSSSVPQSMTAAGKADRALTLAQWQFVIYCPVSVFVIWHTCNWYTMCVCVHTNTVTQLRVSVPYRQFIKCSDSAGLALCFFNVYVTLSI